MAVPVGRAGEQLAGQDIVIGNRGVLGRDGDVLHIEVVAAAVARDPVAVEAQRLLAQHDLAHLRDEALRAIESPTVCN